ncbi:MAG: DUF262 domain-containing protein, partial [Gammaproteobacteria bacterium]|nr:DUF262 domain-containing protein [Gammaproteobacteria bacterium]
MKSEDRTLGDILEISKQYIIPVFQRYYQWDSKHWQELWRDLDSYLPMRMGVRPTAKHFMGPIVGFEVENTPDQWVVIDGQQRVTTVVILLIAIRDAARELEQKVDPTQVPVRPLSERINDRFLTTRRGALKLKPREDADPLKSDYLTFESLMH